MSESSTSESHKDVASSGIHKRSYDSLADDEMSTSTTKKIPRLFPIFAQVSSTNSSASFRWLQPALGPKQTCLLGVNLDPRPRAKVAAFDLDGTIIKSFSGKKAGQGHVPRWEWWNRQVPHRLKQVYDDGHSIVIVSNQAIKTTQLPEWKRKIHLIAASIPDIPFRLFAATARDEYRKPMTGIWDELDKISRAFGVEIGMFNSTILPKDYDNQYFSDKEFSYFVGDAASRPGDFSGTDRKWAMNVGLKFFTPEEFFLHLPPAAYKLSGFDASTIPMNGPSVTPSSAPLVPVHPKSSKPEIVLFVGYPAIGKSTFFYRHFAAIGYAHINQDKLGSRPKCLKAVEDSVESGVSCVVDNTNRDMKTRKLYVDLAKRLGVSIRCVVFDGSMELAWHNNLYRAFCQPSSLSQGSESKRDLVPYAAFSSFRDNFEQPSANEGFKEIITAHWVFEGETKELERWKMWLQIDGK